MDAYAPLLERTRLPQPSFQKFAVISIFDKLRSAPSYIGLDSDAGRDAITQCLTSNSPAVVDQSVRELCKLVKDSKLDLSRGLSELQSSLEGCDSCFVNVFVKAVGFLVRLGFQNDASSFRFGSSEAHPFVKILSCRAEVQSELVQQVNLFVLQNKHLGMRKVCEFLRPFVNYSIIGMHSSAMLSSFARNLLSSMASMCCSFPREAIPVIKLLMGCFKYFSCNNAEDFIHISYLMEYVVDAFIVVLRHLVEMDTLIHEAHVCGVELLEVFFSLHINLDKSCGGGESMFEISRRLLMVQREIGLSYIPELSAVILSMFVCLIQSQLEHVQLSILKLLIFLLKWKSDNECSDGLHALNQECLFVFPVINLISSPSRPVKEATNELLIMLGKPMSLFNTSTIKLLAQEGFPCISRPESIVFRLLQHLWFQDQSSLSNSPFLHWASGDENNVIEKQTSLGTWISSITVYSQKILERKRSSLPISKSQETFLREMPFLLGAIASALVVHPTWGKSAVDLLAVSGTMDPKLGVPLLLVVLFYNNILCRKFEEVNFHEILLKLLGILPSLSLHPAMMPLIVQTILPMLQKDAKPVLYATATRLLCKTWETNDRVFGSLQGVLLPKGFTQFQCERNICVSMAVSIRDVCRRNPDRGVDLILSVSACIESKDHIIQALGLQSLAHLCEADVIDFYTAWDVIAKHVQNYSTNPVVAEGVCLLMRWGAMDAEAYPEMAMNVIHILWKVGTSKQPLDGSSWTKARVSAFKALTQYEVHHIQRSLPDFSAKNMDMFTSETEPEVLEAIEGLEVKIITYEHITRRRLVKEKRVSVNKIEKLVDIFPKVIGISGNSSKARELPGAALFNIAFGPKDVADQGASKGYKDMQRRYENALVEIAGSLQLSRNILIVHLSLQSWKPFVLRWMRAHKMLTDPKSSSTSVDKTSKAANDILKCMRRIAEESIPRSAENIALAIGALCMVLPPYAHAVKTTASKFLLNWVFQEEHEYRQWSAAISLGFVSSSLHVTDHNQKFENINALLQVASISKSTFVKGACGVGLGFSCQDLLTRFKVEDNLNLDKESYKLQEIDLLRKIVKTLSHLILPFAQSSSSALLGLSAYLPHDSSNTNLNIFIESSDENCEELETDTWGVAGLVLGLGNSVDALYRAGCLDALLEIKILIESWIPHVNSLIQNSSIPITYKPELVLSVGSCLALPIIVAFCQRVELIDGTELDNIIRGCKDLICELLSVKKSGAFHQSLLMAACVGAGNLLACILNAGVHSLDTELVTDLLALFKKAYSSPSPPLIHLGGMLGIVNALGASAGTPFLHYPLASSRTPYSDKVVQQESSYIVGPLLSSTVLEPSLTSSIQEIFLVSQNSDDHQLQHYAAWAISFLRHYLWSEEIQKEERTPQKDDRGSQSVSHSFPEESIVMKLCLWLMHLNHSESDTNSHVKTVATALRCLSHAPRLPQLDWVAIIRRCMKYEDQTTDLIQTDSTLKKGILRKESLAFALSHANQFDPLLTFLDELSDLSRFRTLEMNQQSHILLNLPGFMKLFSGSRLVKLFDDVANFMQSLVSFDKLYNQELKSVLRTSCWQGVCMCLDEPSISSQEYIRNIINCMEVLFSLLPGAWDMESTLGMRNTYSMEWSEAVKCLGKAPLDWLLDLLQISETDFTGGSLQFSEAKKKSRAKARLVQNGSVPMIELGKMKAYILNSRSKDIWDVLVEVAAVLQHADANVKRQWLVDAVEISCVTSYPSTALQFVGLLSGVFSKYMPLLIVDPLTVLSDLPVTLTSLLLEDRSWRVVAESIVLHLWTCAVRIHSWAMQKDGADDLHSLESISIDRTEDDMGVFLLQVLHHACVSLKVFLPSDIQLKLANMVIP